MPLIFAKLMSPFGQQSPPRCHVAPEFCPLCIKTMKINRFCPNDDQFVSILSVIPWKPSIYLVDESIPSRSPTAPQYLNLRKQHVIICREATSRRKPRNTRTTRHFLPFPSHSRTCGIDHNVLMKYASGVSGSGPSGRVQSGFLQLLPACCQ